MAQQPSPIKLFQIEEPDGRPDDAEDGLGMAVGIELSRLGGASVAAAVGGNADWLVRPEPGGIAGTLSETAVAGLLRDLRSLAEKAVARPVTHAVIRLDGFDLADVAVLRAAAAADIALLGIRREGNALDAAVEAEDLASVLSH
jgi:coenzyme F420-reducing hydrogenase alpha subunit